VRAQTDRRKGLEPEPPSGTIMKTTPPLSLKCKVRHRPHWTNDPATVYAVCTSHPQRHRYAQRWVRIAWLYFFENKPAAEIAELLGGNETKKSVQRVIERLNARAARLLTA